MDSKAARPDQPGPTSRGTTPRRRFIPWLLTAAIIIPYLNSFQGVFILDDYRVILEAPHVLNGTLPLTWNRLLVDLSFTFQYALAGGFHAAHFHAVNLLIHLAAALLLYGIVCRTLALPGIPEWAAQQATGIGFVTALLWAIHPIQAYAVTYLCQRYELAMSLCVMGSLYAFIRSLAATRPAAWLAGSVAVCWLGVGTKENIAVAPLVIAAFDYLLVARSIREMRTRRSGYYQALAGTWLITAAATFQAQQAVARVGMRVAASISSVSIPATSVSRLEYLLSQPGVILQYIRLALVPHPLVLDYNWPVAVGFTGVALPTLAVGGMAVAAVYTLIRRHRVGFPLVAFFLILAPSSSVLPLDDLLFLHRLYLPLAAVIFPLIMAGAWLTARLHHRSATQTLSAFFTALALLSGWLTIAANREFHSEIALWTHNIAIRPHAWRARNALAVALCEAGRTAEAIPHFLYTLHHTRQVHSHKTPPPPPKIPQYHADQSEHYVRYRALSNLGRAYAALGHTEPALTAFAWALRIEPYADETIQQLRSLLLASGVDKDRTDDELTRRVWLTPGDLNSLPDHL